MRNSMQHVLTTAALLAIHMAVVLGLPTNTAKNKWNDKQLTLIQQHMSTQHNPCEDFFGYACGRWPEMHKTERYSEYTGYVDHMINKKLVTLMKSPLPARYANSAYEQVWTYFRSCKSETKPRIKQYLELVKPVENLPWPILQTNGTVWPKEKFNWLLTIARIRSFGLENLFIEHMVLAKLDNANEYTIDLDKPSPTQEQTLPDKVIVMALLLEQGLSRTDAMQLRLRLRTFDDDYNALIAREYDNTVLNITVRDLEEVYPTLLWRKYLEIVLSRPVSDDFSLQLRNWQYFMELTELLNKTDPELVCYYIMFRFLYYVVTDRTSSADSIDCVVDVRSKMDIAISYLYRELYFESQRESTQAAVLQMFEMLKQQFSHKLYQNPLKLQKEQLDLLEQKLAHMQLQIDNLPRIVDLQYVNHYYHTLKLSSDSYCRNHLVLLRLRARKEHAQLYYRYNDSMNAPLVADSNTARSSTPYYLVRRNLIVVPAGILQPPIYHKQQHELFKYSLFGFLLAHEIVHAFDESGVSYDYKGEYVTFGGSISQSESYAAAVECMQNSQPTETIDERIADIVGIRLAYDAVFDNTTHFDWAAVERLSAIPPRQLFFLNFAQFFCGDLKIEFTEHDDDNVRLQQTLMRFEPFAEAFQCNSKNEYYPVNGTCRLW